MGCHLLAGLFYAFRLLSSLSNLVIVCWLLIIAKLGLDFVMFPFFYIQNPLFSFGSIHSAPPMKSNCGGLATAHMRTANYKENQRQVQCTITCCARWIAIDIFLEMGIEHQVYSLENLILHISFVLLVYFPFIVFYQQSFHILSMTSNKF